MELPGRTPLAPATDAADDGEVIVGRSDETAVLDQALGAAEDGERVALLLVGDPGMGTTTLLGEAAQRAAADGWTVVRVGVPEGAHEIPFALVADLVSGLDETLRGGAAEDDEQPGPRDDVQQVPQAAALLRDLLRRASRDTPTLVCIDNLQWADEASTAAVSLAVGRVPDAALAVVAAGHPAVADDPRWEEWRRLEVRPLGSDAAVALLRASLDLGPDDMPDELQAERLVRALGHCPAAIVECRHLLTPRQIAGADPLPDPLHLGAHLRHVWTARVHDLPARSAQALLALCVVDAAPVDLVADVLDQHGLTLGDLEPCIDAGLAVRGDAAVPLVKPLVRAALLDATSAQQRRDLHRAVADAAERLGASPAVVVRHVRLSGTAGDEDAIAALERQAHRAHEADQPDVETRAWEAAARLTTDPRQRADRALRAARTWLMESSSLTGGESLLGLLTAAAFDLRDNVWRAWLRAEVLAEHDLSGSAAAALAAADDAREAQPALVPWLLWSAATTAWSAGRADLGLHAARRAAAWLDDPSRPRHPGLPAWLGPALLGTALVEDGQHREGVPMLRRAREQARVWAGSSHAPLAELINVVALDELMLADGHVEEVRLAELESRLCDEAGATLGATETLRALRAFRRGDWSSARAVAVDAVALARALRASVEEIAALTLLLDIDARTGHPDVGRVDRRLHDKARAIGDHRALATRTRALGLRHLAAGRASDAAATLEPLLDTTFAGRGVRDAPMAGRVDLVEALARSGDTAAAAAVLDRLRLPLSLLDDADASAALLRSQAVVTPGNAEQLLRQALGVHAEGTDRFEAARTRLMLGEHLRRTHQVAQARHELRRAATEFDDLGAVPWRDRALAESRTGRHADGLGRPPGDPLARLTPQERRVACAVATGASNRDVAADLVLSVRTVEFHLSNVLRKLGVPNRAALAHLLTERGTAAQPR